MPALAVAVALTFTRSAWVGACVAAALLLSLKDFRLLAVLPIVAALFFAVAGPDLTVALRVDLRPEQPDQPRSRGDAARRRAHDPRPPAVRRRAEHGAGALRGYREPDAVEADQPASAQRAGADCRRARPAGPGRLVVVRRRARHRSRSRVPPAQRPDARRRRARRDGRDAGGRACSSTTSATPSS